MLTVDAALSAAADLIANRFGGRPEFTEPDVLAGSGAALVVRAKVTHNPFLQERSVIIKQLPEEATAGQDPALIREIVSYQFTNTLAVDDRPGPTLLAYDLEQRLLVTTDAGSADNLADSWDSANAEQQLSLARRLGHALGRMHAATASNEQSFDTLLHRMTSKAKAGGELFAVRDRVLVDAIDGGLESVTQLGVTVPPEVQDFAADSARRLISGQHRSFTPFDLSPDNILCGKDRIIFLDYEWAGFRDVTFDVACVVAGFPQYVEGSALTTDQARAFIHAWQQEVVSTWPNVANDLRLRARVITALVGWGLLSIQLLRAGGFSALITDDDSAPLAFPHLLEGRAEDNHYLAAHKDIVKTFGVLARLAEADGDERFPAVAQFARDVVAAVSRLDGDL